MKHWTNYQKTYVFNNFASKALPEIARDIGRSENALNLFLHRNRNDPRICKPDNLLVRLLKQKFVDAALFTPNRLFFDTVNIGQKRYWSLYKGVEVMTDEELQRIAGYLQISYQDIHEIRQLTLFNKSL